VQPTHTHTPNGLTKRHVHQGLLPREQHVKRHPGEVLGQTTERRGGALSTFLPPGQRARRICRRRDAKSAWSERVGSSSDTRLLLGGRGAAPWRTWTLAIDHAQKRLGKPGEHEDGGLFVPKWLVYFKLFSTLIGTYICVFAYRRLGREYLKSSLSQLNQLWKSVKSLFRNIPQFMNLVSTSLSS
jgi:hypothetical protein